MLVPKKCPGCGLVKPKTQFVQARNLCQKCAMNNGHAPISKTALESKVVLREREAMERARKKDEDRTREAQEKIRACTIEFGGRS